MKLENVLADKEEPKEEAKQDEPDVPALKPPKTKRKQLVPTHYYGPPSAGWGGFQPGHTGGGWGAPYWYKYVPYLLYYCNSSSQID